MEGERARQAVRSQKKRSGLEKLPAAQGTSVLARTAYSLVPVGFWVPRVVVCNSLPALSSLRVGVGARGKSGPAPAVGLWYRRQGGEAGGRLWPVSGCNTRCWRWRRLVVVVMMMGSLACTNPMKHVSVRDGMLI